MAEIGIALVEIGLRNAVIGGDQDFGFEVEIGEAGADGAGERLDIDRIVVIGRGDANRRLPAHGLQRFERFVADRRGRSGAILRVEGNDENAVAALGLQRLETLGDRGRAIPHGPVDDDVPVEIAERGAQLFALRTRDRFQRTLVALLVPDGIIVAPFDVRSPEENGLQNGRPNHARRLDDAAVGQELLQIAPDRPIVGALRGAEIDDQHPDPPARRRRMARRPMGSRFTRQVRYVHKPPYRPWPASGRQRQSVSSRPPA